MKSYKLVALDIDGTLLDSMHKIPEENRLIIQKLYQKDIEFVLVTGRPDALAKQYTEQLGIPPIIVGNNGATVRNVQTKELQVAEFIRKDIAAQVINCLLSRGIYFRIYGVDSVISLFPDDLDETKNEFALFSQRLAGQMNFVIANRDAPIEMDIVKISCFSHDQQLLSQVRDELECIADVEVVRGASVCLDVMKRGISKGNALINYANQKGITPEEIIAFGDSENDASMLELVGMPIAMGNAEDSLKVIAKKVTSTNDQAGVAKALGEIF
ncbi:Cof-type HAD-IIB family hydrolase [Entomospira nematocerorum]|uniref:HAD family phosphatase n=1 Tax=Entomospira nematocerorum TaxID=2719987 RepID=A0A968GAZ6_9SPIO|nr:Cof-type HAD-IIB family hydrolase [Entomospira nematocera]NIZ46552.1 HAD family phosphatase [Entomospira nematocera]WDI33649.1 Cof-type HAD-IIB family hydrolase [Entomospira nematocera]